MITHTAKPRARPTTLSITYRLLRFNNLTSGASVSIVMDVASAAAAENVFVEDVAVEHVDDALCVFGVLLAVRHHQDRGAFAVQLRQQVHHVFAVAGIEVTR